jgi:outer membrane protein assembly factor BamD (BamD/ComL family)
MKKIMLGLAVLGATALMVSAAPYIIMQDGTRKDGVEGGIRANSKGDIILKTADGGEFTYPKASIKLVHADPPPEYQQVRPLVEAKKYDEAIALLNTVAAKMRNLGLDLTCRAQIGRIQAEFQNKPKEAIETFDALFRDDPMARNDPNIMWAYLGALGKGDDAAKQKLINALDQMVKSPDRANAAKAQTMRGDLKMAAGDARGAARDYLRTAVLFEAEKEAMPEALFKAGEALDKMKDPRAKRMFARVVQEFPDSEYAEPARKRGGG